MSDHFLCPDCEQPSATALGSLCRHCAEWRERKFRQMDDEYQEMQERQARRRMTPSQRFAEGLADMVKVGGRGGR